MKGRERKMPITTIIIGALVLVILILVGVIKEYQADVKTLDRKYSEMKLWYIEETERALNYAKIIDRKNAVISELERIKGVAVSEVTYYAPTGNNTATGTTPEAGKTVAVDPSLIPLGSEVYIEGLGWYKAEDTGGAIRGSDIDVFVNSEAEAQRGGRDHLRIIWRDARNANTTRSSGSDGEAHADK